MTLKIGVCGAGGFGKAFMRLFKAHPLVDEVSVAELLPERRQKLREGFGIDKIFDSLDDLCASDVDAIAIFTQRWTHGPLAIKALRAGKHVYSAVPTAVTIEELHELVEDMALWFVILIEHVSGFRILRNFKTTGH